MTNYEQAQATITVLKKGKVGVRSLIAEMTHAEATEFLNTVIHNMSEIAAESSAKADACARIWLQMKAGGITIEDLRK